MKTTTPPARSDLIVLKQILNPIPRRLINRCVREASVEAKARTFSVFSHLTAMLFAQLSHSLGLNDLCDWMKLKAQALGRFGVTPPSRNTLSHANRNRDAEFAVKLFWTILGQMHQQHPRFAAGRLGRGCLSPAAFPGVSVPMAGCFNPSLRHHPLGTLGAHRPRRASAVLWDSTRALPHTRRAGYGLVAGFGAGQDINSWDSTTPQSRK